MTLPLLGAQGREFLEGVGMSAPVPIVLRFSTQKKAIVCATWLAQVLPKNKRPTVVHGGLPKWQRIQNCNSFGKECHIICATHMSNIETDVIFINIDCSKCF